MFNPVFYERSPEVVVFPSYEMLGPLLPFDCSAPFFLGPARLYRFSLLLRFSPRASFSTQSHLVRTSRFLSASPQTGCSLRRDCYEILCVIPHWPTWRLRREDELRFPVPSRIVFPLVSFRFVNCSGRLSCLLISILDSQPDRGRAYVFFSRLLEEMVRIPFPSFR